jgi:drug/metabolite transporter (DMT)-like permease
MEKTQNTKTYAPHLALIAVQIFFGSLPVVGKVVLKTIPAFSLVGFRVGITALALFVFQKYRGNLRLADKKDYWRFFVLSLFGVTFNQILFITGLSMTKASNTSLLAVTIPIFTLSIGAISGVEKLRKIKVFGIVLAAIGVILLIDPRNASFSSETTLGDILIVVNSLSYGIYVAVSKDIVTRNGAIKSITWIFVFASLICVPLGAYSLVSIDITSVSMQIWLLVLYTAVVATLLPYLFNAWALARVNPSVVAVYIYLQPLIGFSLAVLFLGEPIDFHVIIAGILIFAGVFLVTKKFRQSETFR